MMQAKRAVSLMLGAALLVSSSSWPAETAEVVIRDYKFEPAELQIKAGTTVTWINREKRASHSVLFTGAAGFESERLFPGESWQRTFDKPGVYPYTCGPHPEMRGRLKVIE